MLSRVLRRLEALQADLATVDPAQETDAADRVAEIAVTLRGVLASMGAATLAASTDEGSRQTG